MIRPLRLVICLGALDVSLMQILRQLRLLVVVECLLLPRHFVRVASLQDCSRCWRHQRRDEHIPGIHGSTESNEEEGEEGDKGGDHGVHRESNF